MARILVILMFCITGMMALNETGPLCLSRYDYDRKVLQDIVDMKTELKDLKRTVEDQADDIQEQEREIEQMHISHKDSLGKLAQRIKEVTGSGSTFTRWGRSTCPENGTEIVYSGYTAGSSYDHKGGAANSLCLPSQPQWGEYDESTNSYAYIYGAEYEIYGSYSELFFEKSMGDHDMPCAVCRSVRTNLLMVPGRYTCYENWTLEYSGYLVAGYYSHNAASEYMCLDEKPERMTGGAPGLNGRLFYLVEAKCGSLECPPYVEGRELSCAVCTL